MGLFNRNKETAAEPEVIDLREPAADAPAAPQPGSPTRCSECNGFGYLDHIDLAAHVQREHCKNCGNTWEWTWEDDAPAESFSDSSFGIEIPGA